MAFFFFRPDVVKFSHPEARETLGHRLLMPPSPNLRSLDLRGHLEVNMASEVINMAVRVNVHMDCRAIEVAYHKSDIIFNLKVY